MRLIAVVVLLFVAVTARAEDDNKTQSWIVSTRQAPTHCDPAAGMSQLRFWRLDEDNCWTPVDAADFHAADDLDVPTVVFVHGNQTDADEAIWKGGYVQRLIEQSSGCRPFRFVIWSWPAEKVCRRNSDDIRLKAARSDIESCYLARWLDGLRPGVRVSLVGHSFGPRIITGALHLLAGGELAGRQMPPATVTAWSSGKRNTIRGVLLAAAIDADWLAADGCHSQALSLVERMLVTQNCCDRVLRWYPKIYGRCGPQGMGFVGPRQLTNPAVVEVVDVSATVGKKHDWRCYCSASNVRSRWAHYAFLEVE